MSALVQQQVSIRPHNTFAIDCIAHDYAAPTTLQELQDCLTYHRPDLVIGQGSNLLFVDPFYNGFVLHPALRGIEVADADPRYIHVSVNAGENWHDFVMWCVAQNYGGLENLALIPGSVGAAPIQNIGAYGVELADCLFCVQAINVDSGDLHTLTAQACELAYRSSRFKASEPGQWLIVSVVFRLSQTDHRVQIHYHTLRNQLSRYTKIGIGEVAHAVIALRQQRLPDPARLPNAGSFFTNPIIATDQYQALKDRYPDIPAYQYNENYKISAAWLIEACGWKGHRLKHCGVHQHHALVLINHNQAQGKELKQLADAIQDSVWQRFAIWLEPEVQVVTSPNE